MRFIWVRACGSEPSPLHATATLLSHKGKESVDGLAFYRGIYRTIVNAGGNLKAFADFDGPSAKEAGASAR